MPTRLKYTCINLIIFGLLISLFSCSQEAIPENINSTQTVKPSTGNSSDSNTTSGTTSTSTETNTSTNVSTSVYSIYDNISDVNLVLDEVYSFFPKFKERGESEISVKQEFEFIIDSTFTFSDGYSYTKTSISVVEKSIQSWIDAHPKDVNNDGDQDDWVVRNFTKTPLGFTSVE
ncbi:MAG: hypothetical protein C7M88_09330, partial [Candidatus Arcticimaribacter sp.]